MYLAHPAANALPMMSDSEYAELKADIKANGCHTPIEIYRGMIIDGRHRYRACIELGLELDLVTVDDFTIGSNPWTYVRSGNLRRRQLSKSQIAAALIALETSERENSKEKAPRATAAKLAKEHGVSERVVEAARVVQKKGAPGVVEAVQDGTLGACLAEELVNAVEGHAEQEELVKEARKAKKPSAEVAKRISGGMTFDVEEIEAAEEPGKKPKNGAPVVATKDRKEAVKACDALSRSLQKLGVYEEFIRPMSQIRERIQAI